MSDGTTPAVLWLLIAVKSLKAVPFDEDDKKSSIFFFSPDNFCKRLVDIVKSKVLVSLFVCFVAACSTQPKMPSAAEKKFFYSVGQGNLTEVQAQLKKGIRADFQDDQGVTPLMLASFRGRLEIAEQLLTAGAQLEQIDRQKRSALFYAVEGRQEGLVRLLLKNKIDVNRKDQNNLTPLMVAAHHGLTSIVEILIAAGADLNQAEENGWNPLLFSVGGQFQNVALRLINAGAELNHQDRDGQSAGHIAVDNGDLPMLKMLVEKGLDVSLKDRQGKTVQDMSFDRMRFDFLDYLEQGRKTGSPPRK